MLWKYLIEAYRGKLVWMRLRKQYGEGYYPSRYILFPSTDDEYNAWGMLLLGAFKKKHHYDHINIVVFDKQLAIACENLTKHNVKIITITHEEMNCLIRLFALVNLNSEITIVSVTEPYNTGAERLLGKKGITKRELVWYDVYRLDDTKEEYVDIHSWKNAEKYTRYYSLRGKTKNEKNRTAD